MKKTLVLLVAVMPLLGQDCIGVHYEIIVEPKDGGFQRTLKAVTKGQGGDKGDGTGLVPAANELERIAALYGQPKPKGDTVTGRFTQRTPDDVGGAGFYKRLNSPLGSVWGYVERFRGNDDLVWQIDRIRKGVVEIVAVLSGWFRAELGPSPQADRLCAFINGQFCRDFENVALYIWVGKFWSDHDASYDRQASSDLLARLAVYVLERGYVRVDDVPLITHAVATDQPKAVIKIVQRLVASKMGVPDDRPIPKSLAFLSDMETAEKSLEAYLAGTDKYKQLLKEHRRRQQQEGRGDGEPTPPSPMQVLSDPLKAVAVPFWGFLTSSDAVKLSFLTPVEPMLHNGKWDAESGKVAWSCTVRRGDDCRSQLPAVFWAVWDKPNEPLQTKHFGRVVLRRERLAGYCIWHNGLTAAQAGQWDAFVAKLKPGDDLKAKARKMLADGKDIGRNHYAGMALKLLEGEGDEDE